MAELSSNWKKLQAKLKAESRPADKIAKRKAPDQAQTLPTKRSKHIDGPRQKPRAKLSKENVSREQMGGVQSLEKASGSTHSNSPSMSLWASDSVSPEAIAEAYDLGLKDNSAFLSSAHDKINNGLTDSIEVGKYVAIDCEMVGVGDGGYESALARVSVVDFHGRQIYDSYVKPREFVTNWRTAVSGIMPSHMKIARKFDQVQQQIHEIIDGRILVGHDVKHDLEVLMLDHPSRDTRDTARHHEFKKFGHGRKPALRNLAQQILGVEIQSGVHSSIEDARVAMLLFRKYKAGFDTDNAQRFAPKPSAHKATPGKGNKRGKKGKKSGTS